MARPRGRAQLTKAVLASDLSDLLDLPRGKHGRCDVATKIVDSVFRVIIDALHRGDTVYVRGLGKFYVGKTPGAAYRPFVQQGVLAPVIEHSVQRPIVRFKADYKLTRHNR